MFIRKGIIVLLSLWLDKDKNAVRFPFWRERADHPPRRMGESRLLYVRTKGNIAKALSIIYLYTGYIQGKWEKGEFICQSTFMESPKRKIMLDIFVRQ